MCEFLCNFLCPLSRDVALCMVNIFIIKPALSNHSSSKCEIFLIITVLVSSIQNVSLETPKIIIARCIVNIHNSSVGIVWLLIETFIVNYVFVFLELVMRCDAGLMNIHFKDVSPHCNCFKTPSLQLI